MDITPESGQSVVEFPVLRVLAGSFLKESGTFVDVFFPHRRSPERREVLFFFEVNRGVGVEVPGSRLPVVGRLRLECGDDLIAFFQLQPVEILKVNKCPQVPDGGNQRSQTAERNGSSSLAQLKACALLQWRLDEFLLDQVLTQLVFEAQLCDTEAKQESAAAVVFAEESPAPSVDSIMDDVYWESDNNTEASKIGQHFFND